MARAHRTQMYSGTAKHVPYIASEYQCLSTNNTQENVGKYSVVFGFDRRVISGFLQRLKSRVIDHAVQFTEAHSQRIYEMLAA